MNKYICNIYIALWCIYGLQGTFYQTGGLFAHVLIILLLAISMYYFVVSNVKFKLPKVMNVLSLLVVIWSIYGFVNILYGNGAEYKVPSYFYLRNIYCSLLPVYVFYYFSKREILTEQTLKRWLFVFLAIAITQFYRERHLSIELLAERGIIKDEVTNNASYLLLSFIPLISFYNKKPLVQYVLLSVCLIYVLMGMKRGAIVTGALCFLWFLVNSVKRKEFNRKRIFMIIVIVFVVIGAIYVVQYMLQNSDYFNERLEKTISGDSSGRDSIYTSCLNYFFSQISVMAYMFGNGADATLRIFGEFAHNDWLEIAINNGIVVLVIFFIYWIRLFQVISSCRKTNYTFYMVLSTFFVIYFTRTFFSMSYSDISVYSNIALGFALANLNKIEKNTSPS